MKTQKGSCGYNRMFGPIGAFSADLEDILTNVFGDESHSDFYPRANIGESETGYEISMELPGVTNDAVNVEIQEGRLEISGEKSIPQEDTLKWTRTERPSGKFKRVFEFSKPVDLDTISATFQHGVLLISIPKSAKAMPRKVEINVKD